MLALVLALSLTGSSCSVDADCTLRTRCTCDCCPEPEAMTKSDAEADQKRCAALGECSRPCKAKCRKLPPEVAVCRSGRCVKETADAGR